MQRREFIKTVSRLGLSIPFGFWSFYYSKEKTSENQNLPNIIYILVDEMRICPPFPYDRTTYFIGETKMRFIVKCHSMVFFVFTLTFFLMLFNGFSISLAAAREYHVSVQGNDNNEGSASHPLRTISAAARLAHPGDIVTVHEGVYRERINPLRSGISEQRIIYQAAKGENVVIKGSEVIKEWTRVKNETWRVRLPNDFFGDFNPYRDVIHGDWFNDKGREHHTGAVYVNGHWLTEAAQLDSVLKPAGESPFWFSQVQDSTTIWAQFMDVNPNEAEVEINVRQTVFYPEATGINYLTVRGFTMEHAATPWSPPTAEQIGLLGTHWSRGWIIENNEIRYSTCVGITLGKYGDQWDNTSQNSAEGYVETIERALANGWSKENIGSHVVRNNSVSFCEQAGIVGSLGAIFSSITDNTIHDIHVRQLFTGAEMAGIKIHAAIDTEISRNHIYQTCRGIWLDWMAQGARVTQNLLHDNQTREDLFMEVNHGPFLIDNNIFLSNRSLADWSQGGAYVHNLFSGSIVLRPVLNRSTPYHKAHSTEVADLQNIPGGDNRFYNNLVLHSDGLTTYDETVHPVWMDGNVYINGATPCHHEVNPIVASEFDPDVLLVDEPGGPTLHLNVDRSWVKETLHKIVTSDRLNKAKIPNLPYEKSDGSPYRIDTDYFGTRRHQDNPFPGPFEFVSSGKQDLKLWPIKSYGKIQPSKN
jgi:alpha-N-arabinofuranosidase